MSGEAATVRVDVFAARRADLSHFDPVEGPSAAGWASVDSSEWAGGLDRLVAEIAGLDSDEFGDHELIFPARAAGDWDGPWLVRIPDDVVDAFAVLSRDEIANYAQRADLPDEQADRTLALWDLCRRARGDRADLYLWSTD
jgi:hypothetical protein